MWVFTLLFEPLTLSLGVHSVGSNQVGLSPMLVGSMLIFEWVACLALSLYCDLQLLRSNFRVYSDVYSEHHNSNECIRQGEGALDRGERSLCENDSGLLA